MRVPRLYTDQPLKPGRDARLEDRSAHYLSRVLRHRPGLPLILFNGDGHDYDCETVDPRCLTVRVNGRLPAVPESRLRIVLVQAVGKGGRMDASLQKATELGVAAIQPLLTERTEVKLEPGRQERRMEHWRGVLVAACEQCLRAVVPELREPLALGDWLASDSDADRLALLPDAAAPLASVAGLERGVELLVGPEGGFSEAELQRLGSAGVRAVSLGPRVLRTETAGPAAIAVLQSLHGDLR